jgi:hypothetical protein
MLHRERNSQGGAAKRQSKRGINGFRVIRINPDADFGSTLSAEFRINNL